jgi:hypothetical protein
MPHKSVEQAVDTIRLKASAWHAAQDREEKLRVESQIGEVVFRTIFAEDTTILGPWQLRTKGKRKEEKYETFKTLWDALCSAGDLGIASRDLLAWCRSVALQRLLIDKGLNAEQLDWARLCEIQRMKSVNRMIAEARMGTKGQSTGQAAPHQGLGGSSHEEVREIAQPVPRTTTPETEAAHARLQPAPLSTDQAVAAHASVAGLERILGEPAQLLADPAYVKLMADPANFKDLSPVQREQLRSRVERIAQEMEAYAEAYRDFEAVLRWSRRF